GRAVGEHEPVAVAIEGAAGTFGLVVAERDGARVGEACDLGRIDEGVAAARQHGVARALAYVPPGLADPVQPGGAGIADREVRPLEGGAGGGRGGAGGGWGRRD